MSKVAELKADMVPAAVPTPPIPENLGRKIPSLHCHIQPIMPLVFDDSMTFYECLAKCTAYVNAIGEQINGLTDGMKEFLEYMVKWGEELDAQWVQYQADLNKAWADYQNVINGQITDLENSWQAYQTNLNQQWQTFKSQYLNEWNQYKADFQQEWQEFKDSIETTIEGQVLAWMTNNAKGHITSWLEEKGIPGWEEVSAVVTGSFFNFSGGTAKALISRPLNLIYVTYEVSGSTQSITNNSEFIITVDADVTPFNENITGRGLPVGVVYMYLSQQTAQLKEHSTLCASNVNNKLVLNTGNLMRETFMDCYSNGSTLIKFI